MSQPESGLKLTRVQTLKSGKNNHVNKSSTGILMMSKDRVEVVLQIHHQKYDIRVYVCEINNNFLLNSSPPAYFLIFNNCNEF